jgi:hypothetical protein
MEFNSEVALGFKAGAENTYSLTVTGIESFDAAIPLLLEDVKTNSTVDLRQNPVYSFIAAPGEVEHRFTLHFKNTGSIMENSADQVSIYGSQHTVYISNPSSLKGTVDVYDITGRLLVSIQMSGKLNKLEMGDLTGNLMVKVVTEKGITNGKLFLNK